MNHLTESDCSAWIDGALEPGPRREAERHLAACAECREAIAELEAQDKALARLLEHDPGEAYFASFADRVAERVRAEGRSLHAAEEARVLAGFSPDAEAAEPAPATERRLRQAAPPAGSLLEILGRWLSPPRLAWVGATAAVLAAAGVVFLVSREGPVRTLQDRNLSVRSQQAEGVAPPPQATAPAPTAAQEESAPSAEVRKEAAPAPAAGTLASGAREDQAAAPPPSATAPSATLRREAGTGANATAPARSREVQRVGGEDVPVASKSGAATKQQTQAPPAPAAGTSRLARIKQSQAQSTGPAAGAPEATSDAKMVDRGAGQMARLCGTVRDSEGRPIANAQVGFSDAPIGVATDATGHWCLDTTPGERTLTVMAVGFRESRRTIEVATSAEGQDVTLAAVPVMEGGSNLLGLMNRPGSVTWPASVASFAADAEKAMETGARRNNALDFDRAARSWERVSNLVRSGPVATTARRNLAEARYRAWRAAPTQPRAISAMSALSTYHRVAPNSEHVLIQTRLDEVRKH